MLGVPIWKLPALILGPLLLIGGAFLISDPIRGPLWGIATLAVGAVITVYATVKYLNGRK